MNDWLNGENRLRGSKSATSKFAEHVLNRIKTVGETNNISNLRVLDFGCGDALLANVLSEDINCIKICDITDAYLTQNNAKKFDFCLVDNLTKKYSAETFDVIYSFGVIQYLSVPEFQNSMHILETLLKSGGHIIHSNILDRKKFFNYFNKPNSAKNILKFIVSGAPRSFVTGKIWDDGSLWHHVDVLKKTTMLRSIMFPGFSSERSDLVFAKE